VGLPHVTAVVRPSTLDEALALIRNGGGAARWLAGGIDVVRRPPAAETTLIDLSALPLGDISVSRDGDAVSIGAMASLTEIQESPLIRELYAGEIVSMLGAVASPLLRNLATLGGSIGSAHPWSDIHCLLLAIGAHVEIYDGATRTADLGEVLPVHSGENQQLVTRILLPLPKEHTAAAFEKFARSKFDVAMLNCACWISLSSGKVAKARIVAGGTPARASRVPTAEKQILGTTLDEATISAAAETAVRDTELREDVRASAEYRATLLATGVRRCLVRARASLALGDTSDLEKGRP